MVKSVELSTVVAGYSAQALFDLVYFEGDAAFLRQFHKELNNDNDARVSSWVDDARTVSFTTPVDAPAFIKRLVGKDVMRIEEQQRREPLAGGGWKLTSLPVPDMPGGSKFATEAVFTFRDGSAGGSCQVRAVVTCSASGPYGLTGTIESFMAESAKKSLQDFLDFIQAYVKARAAAPLVAPAAPAAAPTVAAAAAPPAAAPPAAVAEAATAAAVAGEEEFYDALELPPPLPLPPVAPVAMPSGEGLRFEGAALLYLRYMCRTGDQTVGLLQAIERDVRSLQAKVAQLQAADAERQRRRRWLPEIPDTVSTRQALLGAALLASASAAAALMYASRRQQMQHHQLRAA